MQATVWDVLKARVIMLTRDSQIVVRIHATSLETRICMHVRVARQAGVKMEDRTLNHRNNYIQRLLHML
jgi:hypothetical protein